MNAERIKDYLHNAQVSFSKENYDTSKEYLEKILKMEPDNEDANNLLGLIYLINKKYDLSIYHYRKVLEKNNQNEDALNNIYMCLSILGKYDESLIYINKLLEISPNNLKALNNLAISFIKQKKYNNAIEEFNKILKIKPNDGNILYRCAETHYNVSEYKKSIELYKKTINLFEKSSTEKHYIKRSFNTIFFAYCYQGFGNDYFSTLNEFSNSITNFKLPKLTALKKNNNKINVGFVTADFRNHPVASYFVDFFKLLNKKKISTHIFYNNDFNDILTKIIRNDCDNWYDVKNLSNRDLTEFIRNKNIDLLIDLSGHSVGNRLEIFKNRAANKQATWCGYLASTGVKEIDFIFGDPHATPLKDQNKFIEKIINFNDVWNCMSDTNFKKIDKKLNLDSSIIKFACFQNPMKFSDQLLTIWSRILNTSNKFELILSNRNFNNKNHLNYWLKIFEKYNLPVNRLNILQSKNNNQNFIEQYNKIDICLDTFPYNGMHSSFESAYMGLPLITLKNSNSFMFRTGESINMNLDQKSLIANNLDDYFDMAMNLSSSKDKLISTRKTLIKKNPNSLLFDMKKFVLNFENTIENILNL